MRTIAAVVVAVTLAGAPATLLTAGASFSGASGNAGSTFQTSATWYRDAVIASAPWGYWRLDETAAGPAAAAAGSRTGSYQNGPTKGRPGATSDGHTAVRFNGNQYVNINSSTAVAIGDVFTAEAWIKTAPTGDDQSLMGKGGNSFSFEIAEVGGVMWINLARNNFGVIAMAAVPLPNDNQYHHVAVTKDGAAIHLYQDGVDVTGAVNNQAMDDSIANPLQIGADGSTFTKFTGDIDEPAFYTRALPAAEVLQHFQRR